MVKSTVTSPLGGSVEGSEITDATITADDLADGLLVWTLEASNTFSSTTASVSFSSLPSGKKMWLVVGQYSHNSPAGSPWTNLRLQDDSGSVYDWVTHRGFGSGSDDNQAGADTEIQLGPWNNDGTGGRDMQTWFYFLINAQSVQTVIASDHRIGVLGMGGSENNDTATNRAIVMGHGSYFKSSAIEVSDIDILFSNSAETGTIYVYSSD